MRSTRRFGTWMQRWYLPVAVVGLGAIAVVAVFHMESSAPDYDPQYIRVLVERTLRFGGSYYENGIHNKGPLEPAVYDLAARLGGDDGFWFVIGVFALIAAACVGAAAALFTVQSGGSRVLGMSVAAMAMVHLTLSSSDYAGVLYARNITVALLATAFSIAAFDPCWQSARRRLVAVVVVGIAIGLAVQTLLTACFTATPVLLWAMWKRRSDRVRSWPAWCVMPVISAIGFASAPVYYLVFGSWRSFVDGWWVYARFMSSGTGRSLGGQIALGWDQCFDYYRERPALAMVIQLWLIVTALGWHRLDISARMLRALALFWFLGAWVELVLSQRYSSHYFSVLAAPTIMILATLVGDVARRLPISVHRRPAAALLPLVVAIATVYVGGRAPFEAGVDTVVAVRSASDFTARRNAGIEGRTHLLHAALDLVSEEDDPLLIWTTTPWPYLNLERVSATRYIWKSFLLGEIYLGRSGPEYVLSGTWEHFMADLDRTNPTAFIVETADPVKEGTPFEERVQRDFTQVFVDGVGSLSLRNDLATWLTSPAVSSRPYKIGGGTVRFAPDGCVRLDGVLALSTMGQQPLRFEFGVAGDDGLVDASMSISRRTDGAVQVESHRLGVAGYVGAFDPPSDALAVSVVVGARSAVVVLGGRIVGAVEVERGAPAVIASGADAVEVGSVTRSRPPAYTGC